MKSISIVPQKREFGCAKAVIKTIVKTRYDKDIVIKNPWLYIKGIGTLNFIGMANSALRQNAIDAYFIKKTNVKTEELHQWLNEDRLMIVLFISRENYPHYAVIAGKDEKSIFIANTHGAVVERFDLPEFIERFYLNTRYIEKIEWKKGHHHPFRDRIVRWGMYLAKILGIVKPGTVYLLVEKSITSS